MARMLTVSRIRLVKAIRENPGTYKTIASAVHRRPAAVAKDILPLKNAGIVRVYKVKTGTGITGLDRRGTRIHNDSIFCQVRVTSFAINEMQDHFIATKFSPRLAIERKLVQVINRIVRRGTKFEKLHRPSICV